MSSLQKPRLAGRSASRPVSPEPRRAGSRGFALVELMVVLVIISILLAVALPRVQAAQAQAQRAADHASVKVLNSVTVFYAQRYPPQGGDIFSGIDQDSDRIQTLVDRDYLEFHVSAQHPDHEIVWDVGRQALAPLGVGTPVGPGDGLLLRFPAA